MLGLKFYQLNISGVSIDEDQICIERFCRCADSECLRQQDRGSCAHDRYDSAARRRSCGFRRISRCRLSRRCQRRCRRSIVSRFRCGSSEAVIRFAS